MRILDKKMSEDILLDQDALFNTYYQDGLKIRAICDDLNYSMQDFQVFMAIHVRGPEFFINGNKELAKKVYKLLKPSIQKKLFSDKESFAYKKLSEIFINKNLKEIEEKNNCNFFTTQLDNIYRLHIDEDYRADMLIIYINDIVPLMKQYDQVKINAAFARGRKKEENDSEYKKN